MSDEPAPGDDGRDPAEEPSTSRLAAIRGELADLGARLDNAANDIPALDAALRTRERDQRVAGNVLASAIAYRLFLWILPLSLVITAGLGFLRANAEEDPNDVAESVGLSAYVASSVADAAEQAERSRWILLVVGLVALYFASASGARTLVTVHALVWSSDEPPPKTTFRGALVFAGFAVGAILVSVGARTVRGGGLARSVVVELVVLACVGAIAFALALVLPHGTAPWTALLPGAVLMTVGFVLVRLFTTIYLVNRIQSSSELYGGLGAAAVILLWLYFIGRLLVGAAVLDAALWERRSSRVATTPVG